jgi:periplasmic protein TonB
MVAEVSRTGPDDRASPGNLRATRVHKRRQDARERIHARVAHAIDTPHLLPDPLERSDSALRSTLSFARLLIVAALLHGLILTVIFLGNGLIGKAATERPRERMQVRIVPVERKPPPPPPPEEPRLEEPKVVVPAERPPVEAKPKIRPKRPPQAVLPDPVSAPPAPAPAAPVRRVVGINMASTVEGGQGPAFAVGTSRMGETADRGVDPKQAPTQEAPVNRVSTRFADMEAPVVPPRRLAPVTPEYPPLLREQGIEADVVVVVSIGADGQVLKVEVVNPAPQPSFNEAAIASAKRERFAPATRAGEAVPYTQRYTIRFRLND